ncbi:hypothetical protein ACFCX4_27535 [Kitasatospora sp. NPDC056327]|uniref:hypothetical protein n=1 Tax=Kitasatospora sp. NPDC056327 TaxID=3345785 RepID=UPI0035DF506E
MRARPPEDGRPVFVGPADTGRERHERRWQALAEALDADRADHGPAGPDGAAEVLHRPAAARDRLRTPARPGPAVPRRP